jgi:hypothetical protein
MTLLFYEISFCVLYVQGGWAVSLWVWVEFLSKILGLIAARGIGFILQSNTDQQLSRWRGGVEERIILMIQSAADILGKVHKWGCGGGVVYHFWPRIGGQNSSSCSLPPTSLYTASAGTPILASNTRSKLIYKLRPPPPTKKGGFCLPAHAWCLLVSSA